LKGLNMRTTYTLGVAYHHPDLIELGANLERDLAALGVDRYRDYIPPRVYGSSEDFADMLASLEPRSMRYEGNPADAAFKRKCSGTYSCACDRCSDCLPEPDGIGLPTLLILLSIGGMLGCVALTSVARVIGAWL
jgi:hypothetical protein